MGKPARESATLRRLLLVSLMSIGYGAGCGGAPAPPPGGATTGPTSRGDLRLVDGRPPVRLVSREGDPRGAIGVAVRTDGIDPTAGAGVAVALAALVEARLAAKGLADARVLAGWDGYRVELLVGAPEEARAGAEVLREALLVPLGAGAPELALVSKRLDALSRRPMPDAALVDSVACTGEPFSSPGAPALTPAAGDLERWRVAAHGLGRVALSVAGPPSLVESVADAVAKEPAWPRAAEGLAGALPGADAAPQVYAITGGPPAIGARATLAVHTRRVGEAVLAAATLGDRQGALASRLAALDAPVTIEEVVASIHPREGCVRVTLGFAARDLGSDTPLRVAAAVALAREEILAEMREIPADRRQVDRLALRAGDPREAADRAAWWTLAAPDAEASPSGSAPRVSVAVGLAVGRDTPPGDAVFAARSASVLAELESAGAASREAAVEARSRVERGQGQMWILFGSPCGTLTESTGDAGFGAAVAMASADRVSRSWAAIGAEGWATADGIGVLLHGDPLPDETALALARRLADAAGRSFAADALDEASIAHARAVLLARGAAEGARSFAALAGALSPGHPSWVSPLGSAETLGRSSDGAILARAGALRAGPLRVAVIANEDAAQSEAAVRALDRWVLRRAGQPVACARPSTAPPARPGTYAVDVPGATSSEVWLALPLPPGDLAARAGATAIAAALDGPDGLLAGALGSMARAYGARVMGAPRAPALVVRVTSVPGTLDAAVMAVRALLDRLREGGLTEVDRARAEGSLSSAALANSLDPRGRVISLFRGESLEAPPPPPLEALRTQAASLLRDDAMILVVARPAREISSRAGPARTP